MIRGIGIDLIEKRRISEALERWGGLFTSRVLTVQEEAQCGVKGDRVGSVAARFAAKEAVFKALGTGWTAEVGWKDVEILNAEDGRPCARLSGGALRLAGSCRLWISITHSRETAAAVAVLETEEETGR
jgi:holo-[acyl-carrier protein] synthase